MAPGAVAPGPKNDESSARGLCKAYVRESLPLPYCISNYCWLYLQKLACDKHLQPTAQTKHKAVKYSFQTLTSTWVPWKNQSKHTNTWTNMLIGWTNFPSSLIRCCYLFGLLSLSLLFRLLLSLFCHCGCHCHRRCVCGSGRSCSRSSSRSSFSLVPCIFLLICTATKGWFLARHQSWGLPGLAPGHFSSIVSRPRTFQTNALLFFVSVFSVFKVCSVFSKGILAVHLQDWPNISQQTCPKFMPLVAVFMVVVPGSVLVLTMPASMRLPPLLHLLPLQNMCPWQSRCCVESGNGFGPYKDSTSKTIIEHHRFVLVSFIRAILAEDFGRSNPNPNPHYMFLGFCLEEEANWRL